jgi:hypothetical protein
LETRRIEKIEKVNEMFCKITLGIPNTSANGACVRDLG